MTAACVGPEARERDLLICPLLQKQLTLTIEKENAERSVQRLASSDVHHEMAILLRRRANLLIVFIHKDDTLRH